VKRLRSNERGVASLEFAVVSVLLLTIVFGIITFGFIFALDGNLSHAASEGARASIQKSNTSATDAEIEEFARNTTRGRLAFKVARDHAQVTADVDPCANDTTVDCVTVMVTFDYATYPLVPKMLDIGIPDTLTATAVVQLD
jgi:Flp pilus assembly protein TadG